MLVCKFTNVIIVLINENIKSVPFSGYVLSFHHPRIVIIEILISLVASKKVHRCKDLLIHDSLWLDWSDWGRKKYLRLTEEN